MADDGADHSPDALFQILAARGFRDEDILDKMLGFLKQGRLKMAYHVEAGAKNYRGETAPPEGLHGEMPFQAWATTNCMYATIADGHLIIGPPGAVDGYPAEATRYEITNWAVVDVLWLPPGAPALSPLAAPPAPASSIAPRAPAAPALSPKDWFGGARKANPRRRREGVTAYRDRMHDLMAKAFAAGQVKKLWSKEAMLRRLYDKEPPDKS
jgi:hypothetical protein